MIEEKNKEIENAFKFGQKLAMLQVWNKMSNIAKTIDGIIVDIDEYSQFFFQTSIKIPKELKPSKETDAFFHILIRRIKSKFKIYKSDNLYDSFGLGFLLTHISFPSKDSLALKKIGLKQNYLNI
jgi:hypothetical protein